MKSPFSNNDSNHAMLVNVAYKRLKTGHFVCLADILSDYDCRFNKDTDKVYLHPNYGELKKVIAYLFKYFNYKFPDSLIKVKKSKNTLYQYVGLDPDPLREEYESIQSKKISDYVDFIKSSSNLMPWGWLNSNFENTSVLMEAKTNSQLGLDVISTSYNNHLQNIDLLPILYNFIVNKKVVSFYQNQFYNERKYVVFHPQYLKEFNSRWFLLGKIEGSEFYPSIIPFDRIEGDVLEVDGVVYEQAESHFYENYFSDLIGVSLVEGNVKERIRVQTLSKYMHGLVKTKPFHHSQVEIFEYNEDLGYGEFVFEVIPNNELYGMLLHFGSQIKVVGPVKVVSELKNRIQNLMNNYIL